MTLPEPPVSAETDQVQARHIASFDALPRPRELRDELAADEGRYGVFTSGRARIEAALSGRDDRMVVVVGPCSIHDPRSPSTTRAACGARRRSTPTTSSWSCAPTSIGRAPRSGGRG